jgi:hypothetical protein
MYLLL